MGGKEKVCASALAAICGAFYINNFLLSSDSPIVYTNSGELRGRVAYSRLGQEYFEYLGIPYAQSPVGKLRFKSPRPVKPWDGIRQCKSYGNKCMQVDLLTHALEGEEDCLFLNVYTPNRRAKTGQALLPVMVYIHGGYFVSGSADFWRAKYFMDEDVVLVTLNYRLAALGFLNLGNVHARGNMGLKDQVMALRWIHDNIIRFRGDPGKVTIFGQSAGGASVHLHMLSPMSKGLFHRAITQSGTVLSPWVMTYTPKAQAERFLNQVNCTDNTINCLMNMDARDIIAVHRETTHFMQDPLAIFKPTIESLNGSEAFLAEDPLTLMKTGKIVTKVPWMVGVNSEEGLAVASVLVRNESMMEEFQNRWMEGFEKILMYSASGVSNNITEVHEKVRKRYFGNQEHFTTFANFQKFQKLFSDREYIVGTHDCALMHSRHSDVYTYVFSQPAEFSFANLIVSFTGVVNAWFETGLIFMSFWFSKLVLRKPQPCYGVSHVDDLCFLFNIPLFPEYNPGHGQYYEMSADLVKMWASFGKDGKPSSFRGLNWPRVTPESPNYFLLNSTPAVLSDPFSDAVKFWNSLDLT